MVSMQFVEAIDWCNLFHLDGIGDTVYMMKCHKSRIIIPVGKLKGASTESASIQIMVL